MLCPLLDDRIQMYISNGQDCQLQLSEASKSCLQKGDYKLDKTDPRKPTEQFLDILKISQWHPRIWDKLFTWKAPGLQEGHGNLWCFRRGLPLPRVMCRLSGAGQLESWQFVARAGLASPDLERRDHLHPAASLVERTFSGGQPMAQRAWGCGQGKHDPNWDCVWILGRRD